LSGVALARSLPQFHGGRDMFKLHGFLACAAAAGAILIAQPCAAADAAPAHNLELAQRLFTGMHMDQMMSGMMRNMMPAMVAQARKANPAMSDAQAQAITEATTESSQAMMAKIMDRMIPLYASTFTEKELQDLVNFYEGPSGQAMLAKMPVLMAKMTPIMTEMMPEMQADIRRRICSKIDCSKSATPPAPGS
jgi:hypothetical protein